MNPPDQPTIAPTPRTEEAYFANGATMYSLAGEMKLLERELAAAQQEAAHYMSIAQKATDYLIFFRADNLKAHQMTCAVALERDAERERVRVLREALDNLRDEQNGAPLCTREDEWKEAMEKADAALAATEVKP
jgi:hypothetical protein